MQIWWHFTKVYELKELCTYCTTYRIQITSNIFILKMHEIIKELRPDMAH